MPIKAKKIKINLEKAEPTKLTVENLQTQLNNIGLTCKHTSIDKLTVYKDKVMSKLNDGKIMSYAILRPSESGCDSASYRGIYGDQNALYSGLEESSTGDWTGGGTALGYSKELSYIAFNTHFDYLMENDSGFMGQKDGESVYSEDLNSADAIMNQFEKIGVKASSIVVDGLDKSSIESILSRAIAPLKDASLSDYDSNDSRTIYLVKNYDEDTGYADGVGVLVVDWSINIKDYKNKKTNKHCTTIKVNAWSVVYDDIQTLSEDYEFVKSHFKSKAFMLAIPPKPHEVKIFDTLPQATSETFDHGIPLISKEDYVDVIILHSADIESLGCLDNTNSKTKSTYSKSVTSGFTLSMTQKLSSKFSFSAGVVFAKAGVEIALELSFTETWNNSQTETIQFAVEGGAKSYIYQGCVQTSILRYFAETDSFKYISSGRFMSNIFKSSDIPLLETQCNTIKS